MIFGRRVPTVHEYRIPEDPGGEPPTHDQAWDIRVASEVICQGMKALRYAPIEDVFTGRIWELEI